MGIQYYNYMLTDTRCSAKTFYTRSECKPRYSSFISASPFKERQLSRSTKRSQATTIVETPKKCSPFIYDHPEMKQRPSPIKYKSVLNTFNVVTLGILLSVTVVLCVCQVKLEFEADERCWHQFKQEGCDLNHPQGTECIRLYGCMSEPEFEIGLGSIAGLMAIILLTIRFRRRFMELFMKVLELWEMVAWSKIEINVES
jgi:hypothetical protein